MMVHPRLRSAIAVHLCRHQMFETQLHNFWYLGCSSLRCTPGGIEERGKPPDRVFPLSVHFCLREGLDSFSLPLYTILNHSVVRAWIFVYAFFFFISHVLYTFCCLIWCQWQILTHFHRSSHPPDLSDSSLYSSWSFLYSTHTDRL